MKQKIFQIQKEHKALVRRLRQDGHKVIHFFNFVGYFFVQSREEMRILADVTNSDDKEIIGFPEENLSFFLHSLINNGCKIVISPSE